MYTSDKLQHDLHSLVQLFYLPLVVELKLYVQS